MLRQSEVALNNEAALVHAAYAVRPQDSTFAELFTKYQAHIVPAVRGTKP
jgi:hypothetical protein